MGSEMCIRDSLGNPYIEISWFAEFQIASGAISNLQIRAHLREGTPATLIQLVEGSPRVFCDRIYPRAVFSRPARSLVRVSQRSAPGASDRSGHGDAEVCVGMLRSSYVRSLYRVFDDHSIPSDMPACRGSSGAHAVTHAPPRPGIRLVDVAIPGSPAAHAMHLPCLQTGGQTFEIMCEPGRADRRRCRLLERVSWRTRFVRSGPRASGKNETLNASCTGCSRAGAINLLRSLAASIRRHANPDSLSQSGSSVTAVLHTSPLR